MRLVICMADRKEYFELGMKIMKIMHGILACSS